MESNQNNSELVYGEFNGKLVHISAVESGLECGCFCPKCNTPLIAKKGEINTHHFAHASEVFCHGAAETALHLFAKKLLEDEKKLLAPSQQSGSTLLTLDEVFIEPNLGAYRPDIQTHIDGELIDIEIKVTHGIEEKKRNYVIDNSINMLEIDLSNLERDLPPSILREAILYTAPRSWIFRKGELDSNCQLAEFFSSKIGELSFDGRAVCALGFIDAEGYSAKNNSEFEHRRLVVVKPIQSRGSRHFQIHSSCGYDVELIHIGTECVDSIKDLTFPVMLDLTFEPFIRSRQRFPRVLGAALTKVD